MISHGNFVFDNYLGKPIYVSVIKSDSFKTDGVDNLYIIEMPDNIGVRKSHFYVMQQLLKLFLNYKQLDNYTPKDVGFKDCLLRCVDFNPRIYKSKFGLKLNSFIDKMLTFVVKIK